MNCAHCRYSTGRASLLARGVVLWCALHKTVPIRSCADFEREPGADDV